MATSKAQIAATTRYESKTYDKILLRLRKGEEVDRGAITAAATACGESLNGYIVEAIRQRMGKKAHKAGSLQVSQELLDYAANKAGGLQQYLAWLIKQDSGLDL